MRQEKSIVVGGRNPAASLNTFLTVKSNSSIVQFINKGEKV